MFSAMQISKPSVAFVTVEPVKVETVETGETYYDFDLARLTLQVQSETTDEVYTLKQHPHSHSCTCKGHQNWYGKKWLPEAKKNRTAVKTCKHVAAAIAAGVFQAAPILQHKTVKVETYWSTTDATELQMIDGEFYAPASVTGGKMIKVKMVTSNAKVFVK